MFMEAVRRVLAVPVWTQVKFLSKLTLRNCVSPRTIFFFSRPGLHFECCLSPPDNVKWDTIERHFIWIRAWWQWMSEIWLFGIMCVLCQRWMQEIDSRRLWNTSYRDRVWGNSACSVFTCQAFAFAVWKFNTQNRLANVPQLAQGLPIDLLQ